MAETPDNKPLEDRPEAEAEVSPNRLTATVGSVSKTASVTIAP